MIPLQAVFLAIVLAFLWVTALHFISKRHPMQAKFTITFTEVNPVQPIQLTTSAFNGIVGTPESGALAPTGGSGGPYVVTVDPTTPPPPGITIGSDGTISGTPTAAGSTSVNVTVADSQG
jgi:hypothetical protein